MKESISFNKKKIIQRLLSILPSTDIDRSKIENYDNEVNGWSDVAWTLHNLAECHKGNQDAIRKGGGIPLLIRLLTIDAQPLFKFSLMAIYQVVFENNAKVMELQQEDDNSRYLSSSNVIEKKGLC